METSRSREEGSCLQVCTLNYDMDSRLEAGRGRRSRVWTEARAPAAPPGPHGDASCQSERRARRAPATRGTPSLVT